MKLILERIISGGQTGADQGGLEAAAILGLKTGGTMSRNFRTETGPRYDFRETYGLIAISSPNYPDRSRINVISADATAIFGQTTSAGSKLTLRLCQQYAKDRIIILYPDCDNAADYDVELARFRRWLATVDPRILNVAGNRESINPGIQTFVRDFLVESITALRTETIDAR